MGAARKILMRMVFFGTPAPAAEIFEALIAAKQEILCVVTQPDRPKGRGQIISFSPVKEAALKHALPLEQPEEIRGHAAFLSLMKTLEPDVAVVVAYGKIFPKEILEIPKYGFVNVHASLLPKYRGAAPIQWALLKGEKETGVTIFKIVEQLDAGPILLQKKIKIDEEDNAETLAKKLFAQGGEILLEALSLIGKGEAKPVPQDEAEATYAPSITKESGEIDWKKSAAEIHNRIRALISWPAAHTFYKGKRLKVLHSKVHGVSLSKEKSPGAIAEIMKNEGFVVVTGTGPLLITEVQPEAGKPMPAYKFVIGHDVKSGETLPS